MIKLILTNPEDSRGEFLKCVKNSGKNILLVISSNPHNEIKDKLKIICKNKKCVYINTFSESADKDTVYIHPSNLTALSIAINQAQQSFTGKVDIIFDSISYLAINNDPSILTRFFLFLIKKSKDWGSDITIILSKKADEQMIEVLGETADQVKKI